MKKSDNHDHRRRGVVSLVLIVSVFTSFSINSGSRADTDRMLVRLLPKSMAQWEQLQALDLEIVSEIPSPELVDVLVTPYQMDAIEAAGIESQILMDSKRLRQMDPASTIERDGIAIAPEFHTYEEVGTELDSLADAYPDICMLDTIGYSEQENRVIWALKISDNASHEEDEPAVLFNGVHHACEVIGLEICMHMINSLLSQYGTDGRTTTRVDNAEIWFVPLLNPDGHAAVTSEISTFWRKNGRELNDNGILYEYQCNDWWTCFTEGVNLNRNYDVNWSSGGSGDPWHYDYRGAAPFSESENRAIKELAEDQRFVFSISYHSYGEVVYYPWNWGGTTAPDNAVISSVASIMASKIVKENGGTYDCTPNDASSGMSANWLYGELGTIDFMIEVNPYPVFIPAGSEVADIVQRNMNGAVYLLDRVRGPGLTGRVTEAGTGAPLSASVKILEIYSPEITPRSSEPMYGRYYRMLVPGDYTIEISREGYQTRTIQNVMVGTDGLTVLDVSLHPTQNLVVSDHFIDDDDNGPSRGNGNSEINFGESIEFIVHVLNAGDSTAREITAVLGTEDPYVTITDSLSFLGDIPAGEAVSLVDGFIFIVSTDIPDGHPVRLCLTLRDAFSRGWVDTISLRAVAPEITYQYWSIIDTSGNGNGLADPGERVELSLTLLNAGGQEAQSVTASLRTDDPYVTIETATSAYGLFSPGGTTVSPTPFGITIGSICPVPYSAGFELDIEGAGGYARSLTFSLAIGEIAKGDANLDGVINILDVISVINTILGLAQFNPFQLNAADMNNDERIDILDVVLIVNAILGSGQKDRSFGDTLRAKR